ncbi:17451_t:CDS:1, partial [Funneliformis geosporum]
RKIRNNKKDTTCDRYGKTLVNPNKLHEHLRRKNPCKAKTDTPIQPSIQIPIQISIQALLQAPIQKIANSIF